MKKLFLLTLLLFLTACGSNQNETLTIATSSGYPPYEMVDTNGELIGFDIDLANLIGEKLNKDVVFKDMSFDGVIASLSAKQADMAIAGLSPDPKRDALFSDPYYLAEESPFYIVTLNDSGINELNDIKNKVVGVQIGTIQETAVNQLKDQYQLEIDARDAYNVMIQEVLLGRIDFLVMEPLVANQYFEEYPQLTLFELNEPSLEKLAGNSIALPNDSQMLDKVNQIISELKEDGTLDALIKKWFD